MAKSCFKHIDDLLPQAKQLLLDLVSIESPSDNFNQVNAVGEHLCKYSLDKGFKVRKIPFKSAGNCFVVEFNQDIKGPGIVLMAHLDTVHPIGTFDPLIREEGDRVFGPGIIDCKGGAVVGILAMEALKKAGYKQAIKILLTNDEEVTAMYSGLDNFRAFIEKEVKGARAAINCESYHDNGLIVERKGILKIAITVYGKAAHAGKNYKQGVNAIVEAAKKIVSIEEMSDPNNTTYSCNVIQGGDKINVIADKCTFMVDVRFKTREESKTAIEYLESVVNMNYNNETHAKMTIMASRDPMEKTQAGMELFEKFRLGAEKNQLPPIYAASSGAGSDSSYTVMAGIPSIDGLGPIGNNMHTKDEYIYMPSLSQKAKLLVAGILELI